MWCLSIDWVVGFVVVSFLLTVVFIWALFALRASKRGARSAHAQRATVLASSEAMQKALSEALHERGKLDKQLTETKRAKDAIFRLVTRIERQRDEWNAMFRSDAVKHVATAAVYDRELKRERVRIFYLLQTLNEQREKDGREPIKTPKHLDRELGINALPVGLVNEYVAELKAHFTDGAPDFVAEREGPREPDIDGEVELAGLVEWLERDSEAGA